MVWYRRQARLSVSVLWREEKDDQGSVCCAGKAFAARHRAPWFLGCYLLTSHKSHCWGCTCLHRERDNCQEVTKLRTSKTKLCHPGHRNDVTRAIGKWFTGEIDSITRMKMWPVLHVVSASCFSLCFSVATIHRPLWASSMSSDSLTRPSPVHQQPGRPDGLQASMSPGLCDSRIPAFEANGFLVRGSRAPAPLVPTGCHRLPNAPSPSPTNPLKYKDIH